MSSSYGYGVPRCPSHHLYRETPYRCELTVHTDEESVHIAVTKTAVPRLLGVVQWALLVWTTEMADQGYDR